MMRRFGLFAASLTLAYGLIRLVTYYLPHTFHPNLEIIGAPIFTGYNINRLFIAQYLYLLAVPLLTLGAYFVFCRAAKVTPFVPLSRNVVEETWGIREEKSERVLRVGGWLAALMPFAVYSLSAATRVQEPDVLRFYPWFPLWLAALSALGLGWLNHLGFRRFVVFGVGTAILLFLLTVRVPSMNVPRHDYFHGAETLVPAYLIQKGLLPWKEVVFVHGLLEDPLRSLLGFNVFDLSQWGMAAGEHILWHPLYTAVFALFYFVLLGKNPVVFLFAAVLFPWGFPELCGQWLNRLILLPVCSLFLLLLFQRFTRTRAFLFAATLVVQVFVSPETAFFMAATCPTIFFHDLVHRDFRRSVWTALFVSLSAATIAAVLYKLGVLESFFNASKNLSGHRFTGGRPPIGGLAPYYLHAFHMPTVVFAGWLWLMVARYSVGKRASPRDWVMSAMACFVVLYFQKGLARADGHIYQAIVMAVPLGWYVVDEIYSLVKARMSPSVAYALPALLLCYGVWKTLPGVRAYLGDLPASYQVSATRHPVFPELGYLNSLAGENEQIAKIRAIIDAEAEPGSPIFDFSNTPLLFHYYVPRYPASRYYNISMAIHPGAQKQVIEDLKKTKPSIVIFHSRDYGLGSWDAIPNMVRHHLVSDYLLDHYAPFRSANGFLFMKRKAPGDAIQNQHFLREIESCDWGRVPYYWGHKLLATDAAPLDVSKTTKVGERWITELRLPANFQTNIGKLWFKIGEHSEERFVLTDNPSRVSERSLDIVSFTLPKEAADYYPLKVSSCAPWRAFRDGKLFLVSDRKHESVEAWYELRLGQLGISHPLSKVVETRR